MTRKFRQDRSGAAALEFALIAPLLFMAVVGIVLLGLHLFKQDQIDQAVRLAVRDVISKDLETQISIQTAFSERLQSVGFDTITPTVAIIDQSTGTIARVALSWDFELAIPFIDLVDSAYDVDVDIPI